MFWPCGCGSTPKQLRYGIVYLIRIWRITTVHIQQCYGSAPNQSDKLDPDPNQFADDKPKCMEYELIWALLSRFCAFILKLGSGSASKWKVGQGTGSASKWQAVSGSTSKWKVGSGQIWNYSIARTIWAFRFFKSLGLPSISIFNV